MRAERLVIVVAALAWAWMVADAVRAGRFSCCPLHPPSNEDMTAWLLMLVAMMLPATTAGVRDVAARSYRRRRWRAVGEYVLGYLSCWVALGAVFGALRTLAWMHDLRLAAALCFVSAACAYLPARGQWLARCHRRIALAPAGIRADIDAFRQGLVQSVPCVKMCWPVMVACAITGHDLGLMAGGTAVAAAERRMFRLNRRVVALGSAALGAWVIARISMA